MTVHTNQALIVTHEQLEQIREPTLYEARRLGRPVSGGTVTVLAVRPEEQTGWSRRPLSAASPG